jgi:hypothetical protein
MMKCSKSYFLQFSIASRCIIACVRWCEYQSDHNLSTEPKTARRISKTGILIWRVCIHNVFEMNYCFYFDNEGIWRINERWSEVSTEVLRQSGVVTEAKVQFPSHSSLCLFCKEWFRKFDILCTLDRDIAIAARSPNGDLNTELLWISSVNPHFPTLYHFIYLLIDISPHSSQCAPRISTAESDRGHKSTA